MKIYIGLRRSTIPIIHYRLPPLRKQATYDACGNPKLQCRQFLSTRLVALNSDLVLHAAVTDPFVPVPAQGQTIFKRGSLEGYGDNATAKATQMRTRGIKLILQFSCNFIALKSFGMMVI